jgi:hypothetical protein
MHSVKAFSGIKSAYIALGITSCFLKKNSSPFLFKKIAYSKRTNKLAIFCAQVMNRNGCLTQLRHSRSTSTPNQEGARLHDSCLTNNPSNNTK